MTLREVYNHIVVNHPADLDGQVDEIAILTPSQRYVEYHECDGIQREDVTDQILEQVDLAAQGCQFCGNHSHSTEDHRKALHDASNAISGGVYIP